MKEYLQVPLVNALLVPKLKPFRYHTGGRHLLVLGTLHFSEQEAKLLSKLMKGFEPVVSAVLVSIAGEEALEQLVNVLQILLL